jgi:heptosyltransferase-2
LKVPYKRVDKENGKKLRMVYLKDRKLQNKHIVDRYMDTCKSVGVNNDGLGLDYFFPSDYKKPSELLPDHISRNYISLAIGGQHFTKKMGALKLVELCKKITGPVVILGGPEDADVGEKIESLCSNAINLAGKTSLNDSAYLIKEGRALITHDTGMMHIGAAFKKDIFSIWGNTIPEFGMYAYKAGPNSKMFEIKNLKCRPCSKIGYDKCPNGHFKCMEDQDVDLLARSVN